MSRTFKYKVHIGHVKDAMQQEKPRKRLSRAERDEWSRLENDAMKEARCSLLLPIKRHIQPKIKILPPQKVLVYQDKAFKPIVGLTGGQSFFVDFPGATILQLEPLPNVKHSTLPVTLTVAGRCKFTSQNYRDFGMMMRSQSQADAIKVPPSGKYEWPDVEAFLLCPVCGIFQEVPPEPEINYDEDVVAEMSIKPSDPEYWMLFYPLLQIQAEQNKNMIIASRTICRLTCLPCMKNLLDGLYISNESTPNEGRRPSVTSFQLSVMEILDEAGTASFLHDDPPRPASAPSVDDPIDAWTLYQLWEHTGTWEVLQNDYKKVLAISMKASATASIHGVMREEENRAITKLTSTIKTKDRYGRKCGNPTCNKIHGKKDEESGAIIRFSVVCSNCSSAYYCSKSCLNNASEHHKGSCAGLKATFEKEKLNRLKQIPCDVCQKVLPCVEMKKCSKCRKVNYCSVKCQRQDWITHKSTCVSIK
jgi:MYND finger